MRSPHELWFRLKQEGLDLALCAFPPACRAEAPSPLPGLPDPESTAARLRHTGFAQQIERLAGEVLAHRFPVLGLSIATGPRIDWRRDYVSGISSPSRYFRRVPYLDPAKVGDHKVVWELNRHQHLVVLAQAFLFTGRREFLEEIERQFESWWAANSYLRGINWASALEVAFRAFSWMWVYHLVGSSFAPVFRRRLLNELYRHGVYLRHNLSIYFSPNTHLLGEAVVLHALGVLFPGLPGARRWKELGRRIVLEQMKSQVREDGSHFEQSSYYQVYALDFFLFYAIMEPAPPEYRDKLARMAAYVDALLGPARRLPFLGDDDGGRLFHPYGNGREHGRASVATAAILLDRDDWEYEGRDLAPQAAWWLGAASWQRHTNPAPPPRSRLFPDAVIAVMADQDSQVIVDAGPFGAGSAGHSHSDTLNLVVSAGGRDLLIDPATFTYIGDAKWRNWFRGSAAHNTIRIDGADQAVPVNAFRWRHTPEVELRRWEPAPDRDYLDAVCRYGGFTHRRRVLLQRPGLLFVVDEIDGPPGEHEIEQFWHLAGTARALRPGCFQIADTARFVFAPGLEWDYSEGGEHGWRSDAFGVKCPAPVLRGRVKRVLPASFAACLSWNPRVELDTLVICGPDMLEGGRAAGPLLQVKLPPLR